MTAREKKLSSVMRAGEADGWPACEAMGFAQALDELCARLGLEAASVCDPAVLLGGSGQTGVCVAACERVPAGQGSAALRERPRRRSVARRHPL